MMENNNSNNGATNSVNIDRSMPKIVVIAILGIASFFCFGYFLKLFLQNGDTEFFLISGLSAILYLVIFILQNLFVKSFSVNVLIVFLTCLGLLAAFYENFSNPAILTGIALVFLALFFANLNGIRELKNCLKINFWRLNKIILPKSIAAIFLFFSIIYIYNGAASQKDFFLSKSDFERILSPSVLMAQKFYPELDFSLTFNKLALTIAKKQIEENPKLNVLSKAVKNSMVNQAAKELEENAIGFIGIPINRNLKISEALYEAAKYKFNTSPKNVKSLILLGAVLTIFFTLEILALPARFIISFLAFIMYEILLAFGFANIELEGRSKEIILL